MPLWYTKRQEKVTGPFDHVTSPSIQFTLINFNDGRRIKALYRLSTHCMSDIVMQALSRLRILINLHCAQGHMIQVIAQICKPSLCIFNSVFISLLPFHAACGIVFSHWRGQYLDSCFSFQENPLQIFCPFDTVLLFSVILSPGTLVSGIPP